MKHHITYKNILGIILSGILVFTAGKLASQTYSSTIPTANKNYVRTTQVLVGNVNNDTQLNATESKHLQQQIEYFDGLGRTQQQIDVGASPLKRDIITPVFYDALGRPTRVYLPYTIVNTPGGYRPAALTSEQTTFYTGQFNASEAARAFSETVYEPSPLNRVTEQAMPGVGYQPGGGHTLRTDYGVNTTSQVWMLTVNGNDLKVSGYYPAGKLRMTRTTDADNRISEEFTDFQGKVVLSQVKKDNSNYASTYYVYDDMGWLRWVVTPEGAKSLTNNQTVTFASDFAKTYCYAYRYNTKGLICEKRIPGAESIYLVYDKGDRVAASQDGVQRPLKEWAVTKYDALGRPTETGLWTTTTVFTPEALQTQYNSNNNYFGTLAANNVLQKWYYDNYDQIALANTTLKEQVIPDVVASGDIRRELTRGLLTAKTIRLVNPNSSAITFYTTVFYYDQWGRIAQTIAQNHLGGTDITATKYLYPHSDLPELVYESHKYHAGNSVYPTLATTTRYAYDHAGRTTKLEQKIDNGAYTTLAEYAYNELGQLQTKYLAGKTTPVETQTFAYNIRGNLLSMNNPATVTNAKFGFRLGYNTPTLPGTIAQWGGNIAEMEWKSHTFAKQAYRFTYNNLSWLTAATHLANATTADNKFDEKGLTYDRNGNLLSLQRTNSAAVMVDNLSYTYTNGRLSKVTEAVTGTPAGDVFGPTGASDYTYDVMGRLLTDSKRQITFTYYRETGMPKTVIIGSNQLKYWYDGAGKKLQSNYNSNNSVDYLGSMVFTTANSSRTPEGIAHAEGRTMRIGNAWVQQYHLKDHLGNVRVIVDQSKNVKETNDYYAFGSRWVDASSVVASPENRYKYNGKELQSWGNLGYYDYGARFYNPAVGRFSSIDPLAEKYYNINPSVYVANNPLKYIDPTGMSWKPTYTEHHDGSRTQTGYEWIAEADSYNEDGTLKAGLYAQAIFFSHNGTFNSNSKYNMGSATAHVYKADGSIVKFDACTYPSNQSKYATVPAGIYHAKLGEHCGSTIPCYPALNLGDSFGSRIIELGYPNPNSNYTNGETYAQNINVHLPGVANLTGTTRNNSPVSAGCFLIEQERWNEFINIFNNSVQKDNPISVTVTRSMYYPSNTTTKVYTNPMFYNMNKQFEDNAVYQPLNNDL